MAEVWLRVAVVGSGPAGLYAAEALCAHAGVAVDVLDRLPCPYGLVRYGVAPDHVKMKSVVVALHRILECDHVRFLGNVGVGDDVSVEELRECYDAVVYAVGAAADRHLGVPGEELPGNVAATELVAWYSGHPDVALDRFELAARSVAVIGAGNVALDVARFLARSADELRPTDVPDGVLAAVARSQVEDIHLIGRRGPAQARFTPKELRELADMRDADVHVHQDELILDTASEASVAASPAVRRNVAILREWAGSPPHGRRRRIHLRFLLRPVEILGSTEVQALRLERTRLDGTGGVTGTGEMTELPVQLVVRSVGYKGTPVPGLPFDESTGVIPNIGGRILRDGAISPGEYVAGWAKRGPTGVIGTNRHDAADTVAALLADAQSGLPSERRPRRSADDVVNRLEQRGHPVVLLQGWEAIDAAEVLLGTGQGRPRVKIADRTALMSAASGSDDNSPAAAPEFGEPATGG